MSVKRGPFDVVGTEDGTSWALAAHNQPAGLPMGKYLVFAVWDGQKSMTFARRRDAEIASRSLFEAGIDTDEKLDATPQSELRRILCENLQW